MHTSYFFSALAVAASVALLSVKAAPIAGDVINIKAPLAARAPSLYNADIEVLAEKRGLLPLTDLEGRDLKKKQSDAGFNVEVGTKVDNLVNGVLQKLQPTFELIETTIAKAEDSTTAELSSILSGAFKTIHQATSGLAGSLQQIKARMAKRTPNAELVARALTEEDVAEDLAALLNKIAGVVDEAEGLLEKLPVLGGVLKPLFDAINGDVLSILSSVEDLLAGVLSLVKDLLDSVVGTVSGLPILGGLLGGLLGSL